MALLNESERSRLAETHPRWTIEDASMCRTFTFADFVVAMGFVTKVALLAEKAFHHPDMMISWNRVTLELSTHSEGGLTNQDVDLATAIDAVAD